MAKQAIIIGGGVGGLATAIGLKQAGLKITVFEKVNELKEVGAGLTLWPNALWALQRLGLEKEIKPLGLPETNGGIFNQNGQQIVGASTLELEQKFGLSATAVHRAELLELLLEKVGPENVHLGAALLKFEQDEEGVTAYFSNGETVRDDLLIGADGLHSAVRRLLFGKSEPRYAGYTAWRGICPHPAVELSVGEIWGHGTRFGIVPLTHNQLYWFATQNRPQNEPDKPAGRKTELLEIFRAGEWPSSIQTILEITPETAILRNDICDLKTLKSWSIGRVTLLGDAAHAMTPNMGQGACQAFEDAVALADCLKQTEDVPAALKQYERQRLPRTSKIVARSHQIGAVAQLENPLLCRLRNAIFKTFLARFQLRTLAPVIGYKV
jgi:2-polyprenyl-6-methoxyphenol hydroxylase-like FAD-dependent oxidoreductase